METRREEAAPTFPTWRRRLEQAPEGEIQREVERFLEVLKAVGTPMIDGTTVHFIYYNPEAQRVAVTGEFNQWNRRGIPMTPLGKTGIFYHTAEFRGPVRVEYKFIVDGQWVVDPFCPNKIDNGIGEQNSYFVVGDFQEPAELQWEPSIPHGRVEEFDFDSELLHNRRRVYVYLPPGYDGDATKRFPSFYVHDGGEYLSRARLATVIDNLCHTHDLPPLIAVMVDPVDRGREYWANEAYARFVEKELIPHIDKRYRTLPRREARGVMGASLGGLISTYLALSRPHLFSKVGGQSSAFFLEERKILTLVEALKEPIAFYFDVGKYEPQFIPAHKRLVPRLEAKGCPCLYQELTGGHNWTSWRAHLKDLLTFLWKKGPVAVNGAVRTEAEDLTPPVGEAPALRQGMDRLFVRFFNGWEMLFPDSGRFDPAPVVESAVTGEKLIFRLSLPEVDPRDIGILVVGSQLIIKGIYRATREQWGDDAPTGERGERWFERTLPLPEGVHLDSIQALYRDGVLEISMRAPRGVTARRIPIEIK
ncbi:MAG: alpha/beta hydrolase-fold protein [Thermodesulfobacteriota bacterium]|jgi:enterochelin esterase family protein